MKKILVTGANGFVGTNFSSSIRGKDFELLAIDINEVDNKDYKTKYRWDKLNLINWNDIDTIIHLAGKAHDTKNTSSEEEYYDINVGLTKKIFQLFLNSKANKFIFFSSVKAVADSVTEIFLTEDSIPDPQTPYGKSKFQAEQYILAQQIPTEKIVYILRPCMIHGPGNKGNLNLLYKITKRGIPWPLGSFKNSRSFTSIQNISFVIQELIEREIESGIYQIADDEPLSTNNLIQLMADTLNRKAHIWKISPKLIKILAIVGDRLRLPINSERLKKLTESYIVSNIKLKKALGIEKMPYTAIEGMKKTLKSFL